MFGSLSVRSTRPMGPACHPCKPSTPTPRPGPSPLWIIINRSGCSQISQSWKENAQAQRNLWLFVWFTSFCLIVVYCFSFWSYFHFLSTVNPLSPQAGAVTSQGDMSSEIKHMSISDDFLALEQARRAHEESAEVTTHKSFMEKRHRHSSVPQTARPQVKKNLVFQIHFPIMCCIESLNKTWCSVWNSTIPTPCSLFLSNCSSSCCCYPKQK